MMKQITSLLTQIVVDPTMSPSIAIPHPDVYFWYVLSFLLTTTLIWVVTSYISRAEKRDIKVAETLAKLTIMVEVHSSEIKQLTTDVDRLRLLIK